MAADGGRIKAGKPQFLKVLFADFMETMPIPARFVRRHLAAEPGLRRATLVSPLKKFWHVDVAREEGHGHDDGDVYFAGGWAEFVRANGLEEENFLVFRYEGNMVFTVKVFDTSGCIKEYCGTDKATVVASAGAGAATSVEKAARNRYDVAAAAAASVEKTAVPRNRYDVGAAAAASVEKTAPPRNRYDVTAAAAASLEKTAPPRNRHDVAASASVEKTTPRIWCDGSTGSGSQPASRSHGDTHAHKNRKIKETKHTGDDDNQAKKQCKSHRIWTEENDGEQHDMAEKCTQEDTHPEIAAVAKESEGTLPVYMKVVTPCNLRYGYMNIGKKFCMANGIVTNRLMIIKDSMGRSWPVKLTLTSDQARMKAGWGHIAGHHRIKVGDICVFHLVDPQTFNISIRQAQAEA